VTDSTRLPRTRRRRAAVELFTTCNRFLEKVFEKSAGARGVVLGVLRDAPASKSSGAPHAASVPPQATAAATAATAQTGAMAAAIDCKGKLITTLQRLFGAGEVVPSYSSVNESAVVHLPDFQATLTLSHRGYVETKTFLGERASTKKATEQSAAAQALAALEAMGDPTQLFGEPVVVHLQNVAVNDGAVNGFEGAGVPSAAMHSLVEGLPATLEGCPDADMAGQCRLTPG